MYHLVLTLSGWDHQRRLNMFELFHNETNFNKTGLNRWIALIIHNKQIVVFGLNKYYVLLEIITKLF